MEKELKHAGEKMPLPQTTFDTIAAAASAPVKHHRHLGIRRAALMAVILVFALALSAGAYRYTQIQRGMWATWAFNDWLSAENYLNKLDYQIPKKLGGFPYYCIREYSVVERGKSQLEAFLSDFYRPVTIDYGIEENSVTYGPGIDIGTTESEYWTTYFSINSDGIWESKYDIPDTWESVTYQGVQIQLVLRTYADSPTACALWVDSQRSICISINVKSENVRDVLALAKQVIDMNP